MATVCPKRGTISIHAPRTGSDEKRTTAQSGGAGFQSTLPARGATPELMACMILPRISIHAPRTGSDLQRFPIRKDNPDFNPRSPHGERPTAVSRSAMAKSFQSTLPARGATCYFGIVKFYHSISIHAPRTGSDGDNRCAVLLYKHFNPRSPHGERRYGYYKQMPPTGFQSTLPARGATNKVFTKL